MTTRRSFLGSILALAAAPAIVRAESLMPVAPPLWVPPADPLFEDVALLLDPGRPDGDLTGIVRVAKRGDRLEVLDVRTIKPEAWVDRSDWGTRSVPASWGRLEAEHQRAMMDMIRTGTGRVRIPPTTRAHPRPKNRARDRSSS